MRAFGFLGGGARNEGSAAIPGSRLARVNETRRRRLDDEIEAIFHRACTANDVAAASDLLEVLEKWHARRRNHQGRDRRVNAESIKRLRATLYRVTGLQGVSGRGAGG